MAKQIQIVRLSLVARLARNPVFIGWTTDGSVAVSDNLSEEATSDFQSARQSGASFPSVPSGNIVCFEYSSLGKATDYPGSKEDVIQINAKDANGNRVILNLGEGTALKAIAWSLNEDNVWNSLTDAQLIDDGSGVTTTLSMYTLLFQDNRVQGNAVCALLFKPLIKGTSNEDTFLRFVKGVIKQLLVIDESQPPKERKGYIMVAARASKGGFKTGLADAIFDTTDQQTAAAVGKAKASGLKLLRTLGIAEVSDELIAEVRDPLPTYNVESLDRKGLEDLALAMQELAPYRNRP